MMELPTLNKALFQTINSGRGRKGQSFEWEATKFVFQLSSKISSISNRPHFLWVYRRDKPSARDLQAFLVFSQHPTSGLSRL